MLNHVHTHTSKKFDCASCNVKLATILALQHHTLLHLSKDELKCEHCGKYYASKLALTIHVRGKHGDGYKCPHCGQCFDALIKKACHLCKCKYKGERSKTLTHSDADGSPQPANKKMQ